MVTKAPSAARQDFLSFRQIEEILGGDLPTSARQHRAWWANDSVGHVQSQQWLEVGWRISNISMTDERVTFARINGRNKLYIDFYSELISKLTKVADFPVYEAFPDGSNWNSVCKIPTASPSEKFLWKHEGLIPDANVLAGSLIYSFARHGIFRIEYYLDSGNKEWNKRLYDKLTSYRNNIQEALNSFPDFLEWDRLDSKRTSSISFNHKGAITDNAEDLVSLRDWVVNATIEFQKVIDQYVRKVIKIEQQIKTEE